MEAVKLVSIIDDDPIYSFVTKRMIVSNNFSKNVVVYSDGQEALFGLADRATNQLELPDVIFLDLNMPVMDGWEFLEEFSQLNIQKHIVIYIASSSIDLNDLKRAKSFKNVSNYIIKPITSDKLNELISGLAA